MNIFDETGMCVVPTEQIKRRLAAMDPAELGVVDDISVRFLYGLSRLAHAHNLQKIRDVCIDMAKLAMDAILNTEGAAGAFKTLREDPGVAAAAKSFNDKNNSERVLAAVMDSAAGAFNPTSILTFVGNQIGCSNMDQCIEKIPAVLGDTNPLYLEEIVWLKCCVDTSCSCHGLSEVLESDPENVDPSQLLPAFFACINHERVYGETAGYEGLHAALRDVMGRTTRRNLVVRFPLGKVLRACLGGEEASIEYIASMPIEDRAFASMVYMFLFFSRYANVNMSGDLISRLVYTVIVKILLKCAETLFCEHENSSRSVDGGMFVRYAAGYLTTVIMACPFAVERAYSEWRNNLYAGPILTMVHNKWREECSATDVGKVTEMLVEKVSEMAQKSRYCGKMPGGVPCTLGSTRSVRNREHYLPYGQYRISRGRGGVVLGVTPDNGGMLGVSKQHSNGSNMPCNVFSVLSVLPPLAVLGPAGGVDQAKFESAFFGEKANEDSSGRLLGFITAMIDKLFLNRFQNALSDDDKVKEQIRKAISEAVTDCLFDRSRVVDGDVMSNVYTLPPSNQIDAPIGNRKGGIATIDIGRSSVFMQWRRPNVPSPNISALSVSQLELSMSRDPMWAPVLTRLYFFIERISAQITHRMVSSVYGPDSTISDDQRGNMISDKNILLTVLNDAILAVKKEWIKGEGSGAPPQRAPTGSKRSFEESTRKADDDDGMLGGVRASVSSEIYNFLREICITHDYNPQVIIGYTPTLILFAKELEDFVATVTVNPACLNMI